MPDPANEARIEPLSRDPSILQPRHLAVGLELANVQYLVQLSGDANAPHFPPDQAPTQDGRAYRATDGRFFYRPSLRVATRAAGLPGPEVRFLKDADGVVRLHVDLEEVPPAGMPAGARPLDVRVDRLALTWQPGGEWVFDQPLLMPRDDPEAGATASFTIRAGAALPPDRVEQIYGAMTDPNAQAHLVVSLTYGYWVDQPMPEPRPRPQRPRPHGPVGPFVFRPIRHQSIFAAIERVEPEREGATLSRDISMLARSPEITAAITSSLSAEPTALRIDDNLVRISSVFRDRGLLSEIRREANDRRRQPNFHTVTLPRKVPFTFRPDLEANRPIYSAILTSEVVGEAWASSPHGPIRTSPFPNTVYRLPDELRLAYNPGLGTPHVIPTLYRDDEDEPRVRVTLRAVPWHDPEELVELRDWLQDATGGTFAAPAIVIGGYNAATLRLTTQFPESIRLLGGDEVAVSLETGFDLTLDLSLEFYKYLCGLLVRPTGLTGEVAITITGAPPAEGQPPETQVWRRPLRLTLDDIASLPVEVRLTEDVLSPTDVQLVNQSGAEVRIGNCVPRLLQHDRNSVVPIGVFEATTATPFPVQLAADETLVVQVAPKPEEAAPLWNAVQLELLHHELVQAPEQTLERVHELAPQSTLDWKISVECPPFLQDPVPAQYQNLFKVEVQILREGFANQQIVLGRDAGTRQISMQRSLRDLLRADALGIQSFRYRVRNIYFDHEGAWGAERTAEGSNLFVFPNPTEND